MANITYRVGSCNVLYEYYYTKHSKVKRMPLTERHGLWRDFVAGSTFQLYDVVMLQEFSAGDPGWEGPLTDNFYEVHTSVSRKNNECTAIAFRKRSFQLLGRDVLDFGAGKTALKLLLQSVSDHCLLTCVSVHVPWKDPSLDAAGQLNLLQTLEDFATKPIGLLGQPTSRIIRCNQETTIVVGGDFNMRPLETLVNLEVAEQMRKNGMRPDERRLQDQFQAEGITLPVFNSRWSGRRADWHELTSALDWTVMTARGPSQLDYIIQSRQPDPAVNLDEAVVRSPGRFQELVKHERMSPQQFGPEYSTFFSDHCFIGAEISNLAQCPRDLMVVRSPQPRQMVGSNLPSYLISTHPDYDPTVEFNSDPTQRPAPTQVSPVSGTGWTTTSNGGHGHAQLSTGGSGLQQHRLSPSSAAASGSQSVVGSGALGGFSDSCDSGSTVKSLRIEIEQLKVRQTDLEVTMEVAGSQLEKNRRLLNRILQALEVGDSKPVT